MNEAAAAATAFESKAPARLNARVIVAFGVAIVAVVWLMALSGWLGVVPGALIVKRHNVLFDSDMNAWIARIIGSDRSPEQTVHPLELVFWRYPARALAHLARLFFPGDYAAIFGARLMVSLFAGAGFGALAYLALYWGVPALQGVLLLISYLLFTSNVTICLPEHFAISNGLLCISFVVLVVISNERLRNVILGALIVLCGGTSVTHGIFPAYCLFESAIKSPRLKRRLMLLSIPLGLGLFVLLYQVSGTLHKFFAFLAHFRLIHHPIQALIYTFYMLAAPAVGATPWLKNPAFFDFSQGWLMVTYDPLPNPLDFSHYFNIQGVGAIVWLLFLGRCTWIACRDQITRPYAQVALVWILFNMIFHNIWGREPFLFAPAWSWTLMALIIMGARHLSARFIAAVVIPVAICQLITLQQVRDLLFSIKI